MVPVIKKLNVNGLEVACSLAGHGSPWFFLHGWGRSGSVFRDLQLSAAKIETVAPDLPGFGQSPLPSSVWSVPEYARLVLGLADKLGWQSFSVLGHSFGGRLALELAANFPRRVKKVVLTGAPIIRGQGARRTIFWLIAKIGRLILWLPPFFLFRSQLRRYFYHFSGGADYAHAQGRLREILKKVIRHSQVKLLAKIRQPVLLVWGDNDRVTPLDQADFLHRHLKNSRLKIISGASHKLPYEKTAEFWLAVKDFLETN